MPRPPSFLAPTVILSDIGGVPIDAVLSERHQQGFAIPTNPTESGRAAAQAKIRQPAVLDIEGRLTDSPFLFTRFSAENGLRSAARGVGRPGLSIEAYDRLVELAESSEPVAVVTGLFVFDAMIFEEISAPRSSRDGFSIRFTARLRELITAENLGQPVAESTVTVDLNNAFATAAALGFQATLVGGNAVARVLQT